MRRKIFLSLLMTFIAIMAMKADCVYGNYTAEEGYNEYNILLEEDCTFIITSNNGDDYEGTYTIEGLSGEIQEGESYVIEFETSSGETYRGKFKWVEYENEECIRLDGMTFKKGEGKRMFNR